MTEPLISIRGLRKNYPRQRVGAPLYARLVGRALGWTGALDNWEKLHEGIPVLKGVDLDVYDGETLAIVGPSGAGKSTLLHLIGALDRPNGGEILYRDIVVNTLKPSRVAAWRNREVGYIFQFYHLFPDLTALENVLIPGMIRFGTSAYLAQRTELRERARELLERVGLGERINHRPSQLSGGEQQRVAIARALLLRPKLLLCDEPTGNLDRRTGEAILDVLFSLKESDGQTYVIVTHDDRLAARADRVVTMVDGIFEETPSAPGASDPPAEPPPTEAPLPAVEGEPSQDGAPESA